MSHCRAVRGLSKSCWKVLIWVHFVCSGTYSSVLYVFVRSSISGGEGFKFQRPPPRAKVWCLALKTFPKRSERLGFLNFGVVEGLDCLAVGLSGPKADPLVVTNVFVDINFVGKVSQVACRVYFSALSCQKCDNS